tara:strand:+ start:11276 stop:13084 length:1809 start_codon:yes stop_codon:yes gene_type:complete
MAVFKTGLSSGPGGGMKSSPTPVDTTPLAVAGFASNVANLFMKQKAMDVEAQREAAISFQKEQTAKTLVGFQEDQLKISNALDSGDISATEAKLRMRSNYLAAIQANPMLAKDIGDLQKTLTGTVGLSASTAKAISSYETEVQDAKAEDWVKEGSTPAKVEEMVLQRRRWKALGDLYSREAQIVALENAKLTGESSKLGIKQKEIALSNARREQLGSKALYEMSAAYAPKFKQDVDQILQEFEAGNLDKKDAILALKGEFENIKQFAINSSQGADEAKITRVLSQFEGINNLAVASIEGKMDRQLAEDEVAARLAIIQSQSLASDDRFAQYAGISRLFPRLSPDFIARLGPLTRTHFQNMANADTTPTNLYDNNDRESVRDYLKGIQSTLSTLDKLDDDGKAEQKVHVDNIFKSLSMFEGSAGNVEDFAPAMQFLASPDLAAYVSKTKGIPSEYAEEVGEVIDRLYVDKVRPLLQKEFSKAGVSFTLEPGESLPEGAVVTPPRVANLPIGAVELPSTGFVNVPVFDVVEPVFKNGGVQFVPIKGISKSQLESAKGKAMGLNKRVSPAVNQFIKAAAHVEGRTDYQQVFNEQFVNLFAPQEGE